MRLPAGRTLVQSLQILLIPCLHEVSLPADVLWGSFVTHSFLPHAFISPPRENRLFPLQGFPTSFGPISPYRCARNFNFVKLKSFCLVELLRIYLQLFSITFLTQFVKKTAIYLIYSLDCLLRFLLLTTCSLILQTSSTIYPFL